MKQLVSDGERVRGRAKQRRWHRDREPDDPRQLRLPFEEKS
jgi:hypothetical protein